MEKKENDLLLNIVANPEFSLSNFEAVGLNVGNTSLQPMDYYKNNPFIQSLMTKSDGRFDDKKFTLFYNTALNTYLLMADKEKDLTTLKLFKYAASNITVSDDKKDYSIPYKMITISNPTKQSFGLVGWQKLGEQKYSIDELAQLNDVLLNPLEAAKDPSKAKWGKNPHDGFFDYITDPLVLATWEEDGTHIDPITGEEILHLAGEYKIGPNGSYYYEKLDGRDIYGKKVLNKMNTITEEGSFWNKLDFLDSDDRHKSIGGTIMKNLALVGGMFIPYIGPAITAVSLVPTLTSLTGTLGKMASGSDNSFFSLLEGIGKSWELQGNVSEEAQQSTWNLENFINLIGDTVAQLKLQRFIFEKIPYIVKGKYAGSEEATKKLLLEFLKESESFYNTKLTSLEREVRNSPDKLKQLIDLKKGFKDITYLDSLAKTNSYIDGYNKLGEVLSKGYMTAITVHDAYGEAKEAGASDIEATFLTLGYGAAEAWILNTKIGEWILPELHGNRAHNKAAVRKLMEAILKPENAEVAKKASVVVDAIKSDKSNRRQWAYKVINASKDFFKGEYFANGSKAGGIVQLSIAGGLGEGVEEVSEELLADISKGFFNTVLWLQGDSTRMSSFGYHWDKDGNREWSGLDLFDRYGMSFFGGLIGGGITNVGTAFRINELISKMDTMAAYLHVVYAARNGQLNDIRKELNNYKLDTFDNIRSTPTFDVDGNPSYIGSGRESQTYAAKKALNQIFDFVEDTLKASKTNLTDSEFLDKLVLDEWRYQSLYNSLTSIDFLNDFNRENTLLIKQTAELKDLLDKLKDINKDGVTTDSEKRSKEEDSNIKKQIEDKKEELAKTLERLNNYITGKYSVEFLARAFVEMNPFLHQDIGILSLPTFILSKYNKKVEDLSEKELADAKVEYKKYKANPENRDNIKYFANFLLLLNKKISPNLPAMVSNSETETYKKAISAFLRLLSGEVNWDSVEDELFLLFATKNNIKKNILRMFRIFNPKEYETLRKDTNKLIADSQKSLKKEYDDNKKSADDIIKQHEKDAEKAILDVDKEIADIEKEITDYEKKRESAKGSEKAKYTKSINLLKKKLNGVVDENGIIITPPLRESRVKAITDNKNLKIAEVLKNLLVKLNELENELKESISSINLEFNDNIYINLASEIETYLLEIINKGYADTSLKLEIDKSIAQIQNVLLELVDEGAFTNTELLTRLNNLANTIQSLPTSKLEGLLNLFSIVVNGTPLNFSKLVEAIENLLSSTSGVNDIEALANVEEGINNTFTMIKLLKIALKGATTDTISIAQGNSFGFNAFLNELSTKQGNPLNFSLISESETLPLIELLDKIENLLKYILRIYNINKGNKFAQLDNTNKAVIRARYKAISRFIDKGDSNPLKKWNGYNELEVAIRAEIDGTNIEELNYEELEVSKTKIEDAFYNFAQLNSDKLTDVSEMANFLSCFNLTDTRNPQIANADITDLNDLQLVQYMLSCMAMKSSNFYSLVSKLDFGDIAPIPMQIEAARITLASIMNRTIFQTFIQGVELSVAEKLKTMTSDEFAEMLSKNLGVSKDNSTVLKISNIDNKDFWIKSLILPKYSMISLVEGIAGSGKTKAVFSIILKITSGIKELEGKQFFIHGAKETKAEVETLGNEIFGADTVIPLTRKELMDYVVVDFKDVVETKDGFKVADGTMSNDLQSLLVLKNLTDVPKIMFIDEISLFSELDLKSLEKFALEHNIHIITAGDFHQSCIVGDANITLPNGETIPYSISTEPLNFISGLKLGLTMRTGNSIKTSNLQKMESFLTVTKDYSEEVNLTYYWEGNELFGEVFERNYKTSLENIRKLVKTLKSIDDKIFYIYDDETSPLYQAVLNDPNLAPHMIFKFGTKALGDECRYSVVDINKNTSNLYDVVDAYKLTHTGMTRSTQGSILNINPSSIKITSKRVDGMYSEAGYTSFLAQYTKNKLELLKKLYTSDTPLVYVPISEIKNSNPTTTSETSSNATSRRVKKRKRTSTSNPPTGSNNNAASRTLNGTSTNNPKPPIGSPAGLGGATVTTKYKNGDTVMYGGIEAKVTGFNSTLLLYDIEFVFNGVTIMETVSEDKLSPKTTTLSSTLDLKLSDISTLFTNNGITLSVDNLKGKDVNMSIFEDELIYALLDNNFNNKEILKNYPYIGIDTISDLIKLLEGDTSLLKIETDRSKPHMFYLFNKDGNEINNLTDINSIFTISEYSNILSGYLNYPNITTISDFEHMANWISFLELNKYEESIDHDDYDFDENYLDDVDDKNYEDPDIVYDDEVYENLDDKASWNTEHTYFNSMFFDIDFNSFNCLELGAVIDEDGSFVYDSKGNYTNPKTGRKDHRIDSVNGFLKMYELGLLSNAPNIERIITKIDSTGNVTQKGNADLCLLELAVILNAILNIDNKPEMIKWLNDYFGKSGFFINFGFKLIPTRSSMRGGNTNTEGSLMYKNPDEKVYGLDTTAQGSDLVVSRLIVALIGHLSYGEVLEIPLFSISNPITLINRLNSKNEPLFKNAFTLLEEAKALNLNSVAALKYILSNGKNNINPDLYKYIELYLSNNSFLFRFALLDKNSPNFAYKDPNSYMAKWVPAMGFQNLGMNFVQKKGDRMYDPSLLMYDTEEELEKDWIDLEEFEQNPRFFYSDILLVTGKNGIVSNGRYSLLIPSGRNFILVSLDDNIITTKDMLNYYINLLNDIKIKPKVKLIYIIPPRASFKEYIDFLDTTLKGNSSTLTYKIGFLNTTHKVLSALLLDSGFTSRFTNVAPFFIPGTGITKFNELREVVAKLDEYYTKYLNTRDKKDLLNYIKYLNSNYPRTTTKIREKFTSILTLYLSKYNSEGKNIGYDELLISNIDLYLQSRLSIYYTTRTLEASNLYGAKLILGINGTKLVVGTSEKEFKIHGKLDSYRFRGKIPGFLKIILYMRSNDAKGIGNSAEYLIRREAIVDRNNTTFDISNTLEKVNTLLKGTGVTYTFNKTFNNEKEALEYFVKDFNSKSENDFIVYLDGNSLKKTQSNNIFKNSSIVLTKNNVLITLLHDRDLITFIIARSNGTLYLDGIYENGRLYYYPPSTDIELEIALSEELSENIRNNPLYGEFTRKYLYNTDANGNPTTIKNHYFSNYDEDLDIDLFDTNGSDIRIAELTRIALQIQNMEDQKYIPLIQDLINLENAVKVEEDEDEDSCKYKLLL